MQVGPLHLLHLYLVVHCFVLLGVGQIIHGTFVCMFTWVASCGAGCTVSLLIAVFAVAAGCMQSECHDQQCFQWSHAAAAGFLSYLLEGLIQHLISSHCEHEYASASSFILLRSLECQQRIAEAVRPCFISVLLYKATFQQQQERI